MKSVHEILEKLPCTFERVRFMKLVAGKVIGKHSDKIDKDIESGNIVRIHVLIRTNEDVIFTLYENIRDKIGNEHNLKTGHFYYTDVSKLHDKTTQMLTELQCSRLSRKLKLGLSY